MKRINLIGPYPPPMGGISVHIKRTQSYLVSKNIECIIFNEFKHDNIDQNVFGIKNFKSFLFKIPFLRGKIVHFHTIDKRVRMLLGMYKLLGKKVILTVHGQSLVEQLNTSSSFIRYLLIKSLKKIDKIICVNPANTQELLELGFEENKIVTLPAYIHPIESTNDYFKLPLNIREFLESDGFLICANGCIRFYNQQDLYGLDMLIELMKKLVSNNKDIKLIFAVLDVHGQNPNEKRYYKQLKKRIQKSGLEEQILLFEVEDTEFYPILKKCNLFIRPTNVDGYGVSIAEALHFGIPSIASDVCKRPDGTILFNSRNQQDLYVKVCDVINNYERYKGRIENINLEDTGMKLVEIYQN